MDTLILSEHLNFSLSIIQAAIDDLENNRQSIESVFFNPDHTITLLYAAGDFIFRTKDEIEKVV